MGKSTNPRLEEGLPGLEDAVVLVVGGTGLTGTRTVQRIIERGAKNTVVRVMSRSANPDAVREKLGGAQVEVVQGDVANADAVQQAMLDVTHVFYLVGPIPSLSYAWSRKTVEDSYVTGLTNVLEAGRDRSLRQVFLLSAENADRPWAPMSMFANTIAGLSQLMHVRQERLLREEAQRRADFSYVVVRPPILGPGDLAPEPVIVRSIDSLEGSLGRQSRVVSRAAVVELMLHAMEAPNDTSGGGVTFTLSSAGDTPAPVDYDWAGVLAALPRDGSAFAGAEADASHKLGRRVFLLGVTMTLAAVAIGIGATFVFAFGLLG